MLGPTQNTQIFDNSQYEFSPKKVLFIKHFLKQFKLVEEMKMVFANNGLEYVVRHLSDRYEWYKEFGLGDINSFTMRAELYHFVGERLMIPTEVELAADESLVFLKKLFKETK